MRNILILSTWILCSIIYADSMWVKVPGGNVPDPAAGAVTYYTSEKLCGAECYEVTVDMDVAELKTVQVDDLSRPKYGGKTNFKPCANEVECQTQLAETDYCPENHVGQMRENTVLPGWETYCLELKGYYKKQVTKLVENASKKAQKIAAKEAKEAEKANKKAVSAARKARLEVINNAQDLAALKGLVVDLYEEFKFQNP